MSYLAGYNNYYVSDHAKAARRLHTPFQSLTHRRACPGSRFDTARARLRVLNLWAMCPNLAAGSCESYLSNEGLAGPPTRTFSACQQNRMRAPRPIYRLSAKLPAARPCSLDEGSCEACLPPDEGRSVPAHLLPPMRRPSEQRTREGRQATFSMTTSALSYRRHTRQWPRQHMWQHLRQATSRPIRGRQRALKHRRPRPQMLAQTHSPACPSLGMRWPHLIPSRGHLGHLARLRSRRLPPPRCQLCSLGTLYRGRPLSMTSCACEWATYASTPRVSDCWMRRLNSSSWLS